MRCLAMRKMRKKLACPGSTKYREVTKGELGIYLVGDDSLFPWRWKIRPPGFINLQILSLAS